MNKDFGCVIASKMLVEGKKKVRFMYHEKNDNPADSGWCFFCGDEDDEYVNNPYNMAVYDINTILEIDKSILPYLDCIEGMAFERVCDDGPFTVVTDFFTQGE